MDRPILSPALGNYAHGDGFWDREHEVAEIVEYLVNGQGILLTGPRRVGKTSLVHRVLEALPATRALFVDVEGHDDPAEMFSALAAQASTDAGFWQRIRPWFGKRLGGALDRLERVDLGVLKVELQAAMAGSWRDDARAIIAALADGGQATVVAIDELPLLVDRILKRDRSEAELLLGLLRAASSDFPSVRWLVSGSIGLEPVLHRAGLTGMITFLRAYPVDAWDEATTTGAVAALARASGIQLSPASAASVHEILGLGVPYHVQLLMDEVRRDADRRGDAHVSSEDIERVYRGPFLTSAVRAHLLHLESRLTTVLGEGDDLRLARDLLTQAAVVGLLESDAATWLAEDVVEDESQRMAVLREVLEILEHDAYLERVEEGWQFRSRLVRDWWFRGNELGFVPVADRRGGR